MQFKFLAVMVLVMACCVQAQTNPNPQLQPQGGISNTLTNQAEKAIQAFQQLISNQIQNALNIFNQFKNQIQEFVSIAKEAASAKIADTINEAKRQIQELIEKAQQVGADISECIAQNDDSFSELRENFLANEIGCLNNEVEEAMEIIAESIATIQDVYESVQQLPGKLQNCGIGLQSMPCISKVIAEAGQMQLNLPISTAGTVAEVTQFVAGLKRRLEICASTQLLTAGLEASKIVAEVSTCVADKMRDHH